MEIILGTMELIFRVNGNDIQEQWKWYSGTIEMKEMVEIVGNLCELEGVAKVNQSFFFLM